jgi:hypothetical protein
LIEFIYLYNICDEMREDMHMPRQITSDDKELAGRAFSSELANWISNNVPITKDLDQKDSGLAEDIMREATKLFDLRLDKSDPRSTVSGADVVKAQTILKSRVTDITRLDQKARGKTDALVASLDNMITSILTETLGQGRVS